MHKLMFASKRKNSPFNSTADNHSEQSVTEVDLVPMINVVFLLLIFFMISAVFRTVVDADIELPNTVAQSPSSGNGIPVPIAINVLGEYFIGGELVSTEQLIIELNKLDISVPIVIKADAGSPAIAVSTVLQMAANAGILKAGLQTINRVSDPTE